jgi:hypothetical protein
MDFTSYRPKGQCTLVTKVMVTPGIGSVRFWEVELPRLAVRLPHLTSVFGLLSPQTGSSNLPTALLGSYLACRR